MQLKLVFETLKVSLREGGLNYCRLREIHGNRFIAANKVILFCSGICRGIFCIFVMLLFVMALFHQVQRVCWSYQDMWQSSGQLWPFCLHPLLSCPECVIQVLINNNSIHCRVCGWSILRRKSWACRLFKTVNEKRFLIHQVAIVLQGQFSPNDKIVHCQGVTRVHA